MSSILKCETSANRPMASRRRVLGSLGAAAALAACPSVWSQRGDDSKLALVIGNADYKVKPLRNAVNDARLVAKAMRDVGYSLIVRENASQAGMIDAMKEFWLRGRRSEARVMYFSGHGVQYRGRNYLVPVDMVIRDEDEVPRKAASVDEMIGKLNEITVGVNVMILDACRTPPMAGSTRTRGGLLGARRSIDDGLAQVNAPQGTIIAFSTAPGAVAYDGIDGTSPYTRHLVEQLRTPGQSVEQLFKRVRIGVARDTDNRQVPWETSSLMGDFCFSPDSSGRCVPG
jgi:uncharacterized caspase-like protein